MRFDYRPLLCALALCACETPIDEHVDRVVSGGAGREAAKMELLLGKTDAIPAVLAALADTAHSATGRAELIAILRGIHIRESDPRILPALLEYLDDPVDAVRRAVVVALGEMGAKQTIQPLLARLQREGDEGVQLEILRALEVLDEWALRSRSGTSYFTVGGGESLAPAERADFIRTLQTLYAGVASDTLRLAAEELLEKIAAQRARAAEQSALKADLAGAEALFAEALALKPDSKHVAMRLGKFHLLNGDLQQALASLAQNGMVVRAPRLASPPRIDGELAAGEWDAATRLDTFYQAVSLVRAVPAEGRSEIYVGYDADALYIAVKGYEDDTATLTADHSARDSQVWSDDCADFFFDTDLDQRTFYQLTINSIGGIFDAHYRADQISDDALAWNGLQRVATGVEPTFWVLEMELPFKSFGKIQVDKGTVWGFNAARVRIAHAAEYNIWTPTHDFALRPHYFGLLLFD